MLVRWIPVRLHGWLDEVATLSYVGAALLLGVDGLALAWLLGGAAVHFANTRLTDYPQGQLKLYSLAAHARIELVEGLSMLAAALLPGLLPLQQAVFVAFGVSQLGAALTGDQDGVPQRARTARTVPRGAR
jgi:hypothetical protein